MRAVRKMESGPPESCKTMKNRGMIPENNNKIRPKGRILFCDCLTQYAERKPAIGRTVSARLTARTIHQTRAWPPGPAGKKSPVSGETGDFPYKLSVPIRRAEASDRSGGFTRLSSGKTHQARICPGPSPVRRAEASDRSGGFCSPYCSQNLPGPNWHRHCRSGGFTRLSSSNIHQSRVWLPALLGKNPPFPEKRGISI